MSQQKSKQKTKLLLLGFGDINQRLAQLRKADSLITAVRRTEASFPGVVCKAGDATDRSFLETLLSDQPDQIVMTLSPSDRSEQGYKNTYLAAAKTLVAAAEVSGQTPELIFISSTSVYAQNHGEVVNEKSTCLPTRYNGKILLEAEQCFLDSKLPTTVIRFSGIYGPGRFRLIKKSLDKNRQPSEKKLWTNRIHADDCAAVIRHILDLPSGEKHSIYLASDHLPVEQERVLSWLEQRFQNNSSGIASTETPIEQIPTAEHGKRCNNQRLIESGYRFCYPTYKEGFVPIIAEYQQQAPE